MKKILIAGYGEATRNYQAAFTRLFLPFDTLSDSLSPDYSQYDGLVLPGGGDIDPFLFGAANEGSRNIDAALDRLQLKALDAFLKRKRPVLGICKGLQILNVYFGGTILQNLSEASLQIHQYENGDKIHATKAARGTFIERLYGGCPITNSAHHQAAGAVGDGLRVAQYSQDFVIEAMYHKTLPVLGVQWHPERMCFSYANPRMANGSLLLRYFITLL